MDFLGRGLLIEKQHSDQGNEAARDKGLPTYRKLFTIPFNTLLEMGGGSLKEMIYWTICGSAVRHGIKCSRKVNVAEIDTMLAEMENALKMRD
jgi:hypothetical protein